MSNPLPFASPISPLLTQSLPSLRYLLAAQLLLGGQARLTALLTPGAHRIALSKAEGLRRHFPFPLPVDLLLLPSRWIGEGSEAGETGVGARRHSQATGVAMLVSGALLCAGERWRGARLAGAAAAGYVLGGWTVAFWRMGWEWYVPAVNCGLLAVLVWGELVAGRRGGGGV